MAAIDDAVWRFLGIPPMPPYSDPERRRAWLIDRCTEIRCRHMQEAEVEMKPYLDALATLPSPRIVLSPAVHIFLPKDK